MGASYGQFCPMARAAEILTERWTPLVIREMLMGGTRFNEIHQGLPGMSPSLLSNRLRQLERNGILERVEQPEGHAEYHLTEAGESLRPVILALGHWGQDWLSRDIRESDLDPAPLMWDIRRRVPRDALPEARVVIEFRLRGVSHGTPVWWLVLDSESVDLCDYDPGFTVDLWITAGIRDLIGVWLGHEALSSAIERNAVEVAGVADARQRLADWLGLSVLATPEPSSGASP